MSPDRGGRRILLWVASTATVLMLLFGYHTSTEGALGSASTETSAEAPITGSDPEGATGSGVDSSATEDTLTGDAAMTRFGPVQVEVTTKAGRITDVVVPKYPSSNSRDEQINAYALPILIQDTLETQSAEVDMVSGATYTSEGYQESLQSALDQAGL